MYPKPCVLIMACIFMYHDLYSCFVIIFDRSMHCLHNQLWCFPYRAPDPLLHCTKLCTYPHCTKLLQNCICGCRTWHSKYWFKEFQLSLFEGVMALCPPPLTAVYQNWSNQNIKQSAHCLYPLPRPPKWYALFSMSIIFFLSTFSQHIAELKEQDLENITPRYQKLST